MDKVRSPPAPITAQSLFNYSLSLLARRDHSRAELKQKIIRRFGGEACELIDATLDRLSAENYQSEERFAEQYIRIRIQRGFGINRIKLELQQRGVNKEVIAPLLLDEAVTAQEHQQLERLWRKKFNAPPANNKERYKQQSHLLNKGFRREFIESFFRTLGEGSD